MITQPTATQTPGATPAPQTQPKVVYVPVQENNTVITVSTVSDETSPNGSSSLTAVIVSIIVVLVVGGGLGYYLYKRYGPKKHIPDVNMTERERVNQTSKRDIS